MRDERAADAEEEKSSDDQLRDRVCHETHPRRPTDCLPRYIRGACRLVRCAGLFPPKSF
jgi:hypothetical protein